MPLLFHIFKPLFEKYSEEQYSECPKSFRAGFHIILRSLNRVVDYLRLSASVSRFTCFHIVLRNRNEHGESAKISEEDSWCTNYQKPRGFVLLLLEEMLLFLLDSDERMVSC